MRMKHDGCVTNRLKKVLTVDAANEIRPIFIVLKVLSLLSFSLQDLKCDSFHLVARRVIGVLSRNYRATLGRYDEHRNRNFKPAAGVPNLDPNQLQSSMRHLAKARGDLLGANRHRFVLNPPLSQAQVIAFEKRYAIAQPDDSRHFVRHIGNGLQSELTGLSRTVIWVVFFAYGWSSQARRLDTCGLMDGQMMQVFLR
jgi:hypothetical protein